MTLLSLQSRAATTSEAARQLTIAANHVAALGRVDRRLHLVDHQENVEFKQYILNLCEDLSGLLFQERVGHAFVVEGADVSIPAALGIPLGFIVNEPIINSAKYATGRFTVRLETTSDVGHRVWCWTTARIAGKIRSRQQQGTWNEKFSASGESDWRRPEHSPL